MNKLMTWYSALQPRERRMVLVGGIVLAVLILVGGILLPLETAVSSAVATRDARRDDLAWMNVNAPEIRAGSSALAPDTGEAPVVMVDRIGREMGLGSAMRGTQPAGSGVRVQLEAAPFDTLVTWLATLEERHGLGIESISLDRGTRPGLVNANITFTKSPR